LSCEFSEAAKEWAIMPKFKLSARWWNSSADTAGRVLSYLVMFLWLAQGMSNALHADDADLKQATSDAEGALAEAVKTMSQLEERLGFSKAMPLATGKLAVGLPLYVIELEAAKKNPKASLSEVATNTRAFVFPITSGEVVKCLLFMDYDPTAKKWRRGIFGRPNMAKLLIPVLKRWSASDVTLFILPHTSEFLFSIKSEPKNLTSLVGMTAHDANPQGIKLEPLEDQLLKIGQTTSLPEANGK
jgi:hypothetical protein